MLWVECLEVAVLEVCLLCLLWEAVEEEANLLCHLWAVQPVERLSEHHQTSLEEALLWLERRTANRVARGVEGTHGA